MSHSTAGKLVALVVLNVVVLVARVPLVRAVVTYQVFTDRAAFDAALGGTPRVVDFDDVDTNATDPASFSANRYKLTQGVRVEGEDGQFASQDFGSSEFAPNSSPNSYAPGPIGQVLGEGGNRTEVTFFAGLQPGVVAGVGIVFIDADFPGDGPSSMTVFDAGNSNVQDTGTVSGGDASKLFRGIIAMDGGMPVAAISRAEIINGQGWPGVSDNEGVTLDDLVFSDPVANPGTMGEVCDNCVDDDGDGFVDRLDSECPPPAVFGGSGISDESESKAVVKCQKATEKAGAKFVANKLKHLQKCLQGVAKCVQQKPGDAACVGKATDTCNKEIGKIGSDEAKVSSAIVKGCDSFGDFEVQSGGGLGYFAEVSECAALGVTPLESPAAIGQCVVAQHECAVEQLLTLLVPRATEFLTIAGQNPGSQFPCLGAGSDGFGQGLSADKAKALLKCDKAIQKAGTKILKEVSKTEQKCADAAVQCVQLKRGDDACVGKASTKCDQTIAKLLDQDGKLAKLLTSTVKPCTNTALTLGDLASSFGLGYLSDAKRCTDLGFSTNSPTQLLSCLGAEHLCRAEQMAEKQVPRLREFGALLDVVLPDVGTL